MPKLPPLESESEQVARQLIRDFGAVEARAIVATFNNDPRPMDHRGVFDAKVRAHVERITSETEK